MKQKQLRLGIELGSPIPFPTTITVTLTVALSAKYAMKTFSNGFLHIEIQVLVDRQKLRFFLHVGSSVVNGGRRNVKTHHQIV